MIPPFHDSMFGKSGFPKEFPVPSHPKTFSSNVQLPTFSQSVHEMFSTHLCCGACCVVKSPPFFGMPGFLSMKRHPFLGILIPTGWHAHVYLGKHLWEKVGGWRLEEKVLGWLTAPPCLELEIPWGNHFFQTGNRGMVCIGNPTPRVFLCLIPRQPQEESPVPQQE